ncbi:MAG: hypothetical protein V1835_00680 [Candidatus Micrarchaeota archaeon]
MAKPAEKTEIDSLRPHEVSRLTDILIPKKTGTFPSNFPRAGELTDNHYFQIGNAISREVVSEIYRRVELGLNIVPADQGHQAIRRRLIDQLQEYQGLADIHYSPNYIVQKKIKAKFVAAFPTFLAQVVQYFSKLPEQHQLKWWNQAQSTRRDVIR